MLEARRAMLLSFLVVVAPQFLLAQSLQYGKESELRGITKVFVDTDGDLELRNNIVREILDDLRDPSPLTIVDRIEDAELVLLAVSTITRRGNRYTELKALKVVDDGKALRLLWQWGDENTFRFGRRPSSRGADRFVEKWKANNRELLPKEE